MTQALLFDFDGVLVSSEVPRVRVIQQLLTSHGIEFPIRIKTKTAGKTTQSILEQVLPNDPILLNHIMQQFRARYVQNITEFVDPISFTVNFIRDYEGKLLIAIASMSSRDVIERLTKHFGIFEKITLIVSRDDVVHHKPHPEIYLKAAEELHLHPHDCLVFEDTALGVQAARDAGMECCVVLNGSNSKEAMNGLAVKAFIANESELQKLLQ